MDRVSFLRSSERSRAATPWSEVTTRSSYTLSSAFTESSTSTVPGIGSLTGKGILVLGKATLWGVEYFIIRRRLNVIASKLSRANDLDDEDSENMHDDLLELSRPDMYIGNVRDRALHILLAQIGARRTEHLIKCLVKWTSVEMQIFIFTVLDILDPIQSSETDNLAPKAYMSFVSFEERHSLLPFVGFLSQVISSSYSKGRTLSKVLQTSILDFLLRAYLIDFRDDLVDSDTENFRSAAAMQAACISLFLTLYETHERSVTILNHAFKDILLPNKAPVQRHPSRVHTEPETDWEYTAQGIVTKQLHEWRLRPGLKFKSRPQEFILSDVCADLIMLIGSDIGDTKISVHALRCLYELSLCPMLSTFTHSCIESYLTSKAEKVTVPIMTEVIRHLWRISLPENAEFDFYRVGWASPKTDDRTRLMLHFLQLFSNIAKFNSKCHRVFLSANILGLMRPLLVTEMRRHPEFHMANHRGDFALVYDYKDLALLKLIRSKALGAVLLPISPAMADTKKSLSSETTLCLASDVFLGSGYI